MGSLSSDDFAGNERFAIGKRLGAGGMGVVYEAFDRERGMLVALKTIQHFDASALYHFKKEFRALEDVAHPNLVRLWELFSEGDRWFYTMELVEGCDFLRHVRPERRLSTSPNPALRNLGLPGTEPADSGPLTVLSAVGNEGIVTQPQGTASLTSEMASNDGTTSFIPRAAMQTDPDCHIDEPGLGADVPRLRAALRQLAGALIALHAMGKLHRDIKPSNVMVERGSRVVVLDFGVTAELHGQQDPDSTERHVAGTVAYMAPEQAAGQTLSPASDWYSVGVMIYLALTGKLPFEGRRIDILAQKQTSTPPDPRSLVEELPEDLCALCMELLERNPERRPSGEEVLRRLGGITDEPSPAGIFVATEGRPFVGREPLLAALSDAFETAQRGRTVAAFVNGRSGAGKSTLVRRFLDGLGEWNDIVILEGRCFEQESVAYKAVDALIDALSRYLRRLGRLEAEALLPRDIAALARVFPVLRRVEAVEGFPHRTLKVPSDQELRRRAFAALRELLARIGDRWPLILYIDDLQWGDLDSAELLTDLLRPPDAPNLLLLCCYRSEYSQESPCLLRLLAPADDGGPIPDRRMIPVDAMTFDEARDLALLLLSGSNVRSDAVADLIARESGGSPYYVYELTHSLNQGGDIGSGEGSALSVRLDEVLWTRVCALAEAPRRLLEVIAVAGQPVRQAIACRAAGLGAEGFTALAQLRAANLVRGKGAGILDEVETYHDRVRETVERRLSAEDRMACHRVLATELEEVAGTDPETLAVHFEAAGQPSKAAQYYEDAATSAVEALAFDRAAKLYRRVLELRIGADAAQTRALNVSLAEALANAGRAAEAATIFQNAAVGAEKADALDLQGRAAYQFLISGRIDEGLLAFRDVLDRVGLRQPSSPQDALVRLLVERVILAVRGLGFRTRTIGEVAPADLARIDISRAVAVGISVVDVIQGSYFQTRNLRLALRTGEPFRIALALGWEAVHSACEGRSARRRTKKLIALAQEVAEQTAHPHAVAMATFSAGAAEYMAGRFPSALRLIDRSIQLFREECTGVTWELGTAQIFGIWSLIYQGQLGELSKRFQSLDQAARDRGDRYMESNLGTYPGVFVRLAADEPADARNQANATIANWSQHGFHVQHLTHFYGLSYVHLYECAGLGADAWQLAEQTWPAIRASLLLRIQHVNVDVLQIRARSALAAAAVASNPMPLLYTSEKLASQLASEKNPWGQSVAALVRAGAAFLRRDPARATELLNDSVNLSEAKNLGLFAAAARRRLGELTGGTEGDAHIARADAWMTAQGIKAPAKMAACLAPGFPRV